ncbi:hypothetical protein CC86DRAFT_394370 [Ophiobolus disseminans]|uniref:Uncharacterized protein n=1 Tax=Ophiobolus disseminans TaxID=1469910 RepID=A0A6A7A1G1_9PLEO|nr:hypothetical protein CC86DRAFT_394370 [Ophiobolus disseminans]
MIGFSFLMGTIFALSQHFLYRWLHHNLMEDEKDKFRVVLAGRALAYLAKVAFGGCVILVFRQRIWRTFREHALSVLTIDQFFGATEDPSLFMNTEALYTAPVLVMIAAVIWIIPLATIIFSPGALTFGNFVELKSASQQVPTMDFTAEGLTDWRYPVPVGNGSTSKRSLMYYNTTDVQAKTPGWFDYYDQPSAELKRIALLMAYSTNEYPNVKATGRQDACGGNANCTYEQSFVAPGYQCEEVTDRALDLGAPFNTSVLVPNGRNLYHAEVDHGAYLQPQNAVFEDGPGGIPIGEPPEDLGVFKSEPYLWIGYAVNSTVRLASDDPFIRNWTHRYVPHIVRCTHMETKYTVTWNWTEPLFHTTVQREYLNPIVNTELTRLGNGSISGDPQPSSNYISPRDDVARYKRVASYHAVGSMFRQFIRGTVDLVAPLPGPSYALVYSDITKTRLVQPNVHPKENLTKELESFYTDLVLSIFSTPDMLVISNETSVVNRTLIHSSFIYVPIRLWQCYAPVIFVTLLILLFGALTIWEDGTTFSVGFSRILVTTRNTTLDHISRGACLGNDPFPVELMHTQLRFGAVGGGGSAGDGLGHQGPGHCAFGVDSEVAPIERGVPYAGLRQRTKKSEA